MPRQSISLTPPNSAWLKAQVESREYSSNSEVVNDLIRKAREIEAIRRRLIAAEQSGLSRIDPAGLLAAFKEDARRDGEL